MSEMAKAREGKRLAPNQSNRWAKVSSQKSESSVWIKLRISPVFLHVPTAKPELAGSATRSSESNKNGHFSGSKEPLRIYFS